MAKGQKRSTREIRKPKQAKKGPEAELAPGNQVKLTAANNMPRGQVKPR